MTKPKHIISVSDKMYETVAPICAHFKPALGSRRIWITATSADPPRLELCSDSIPKPGLFAFIYYAGYPEVIIACEGADWKRIAKALWENPAYKDPEHIKREFALLKQRSEEREANRKGRKRNG